MRFLFLYCLLLFSPLFGQTSVQTSPPLGSSQQSLIEAGQTQAGFYRIKVGNVNVTALSDGSTHFEILNGLLLHIKPGKIKKLLTKNYQKSPINSSVNAFLIQLDDKLILVDAGSSELLGPTAGKLPDSLKAAGIQPEQITDIFITHIHPDHAGGLMEKNKRVFPNAVIHIDKKELDYWLDSSLAKRTAEPVKTLFSQVKCKIKPYIESGQLKTFEGTTQFFHGFSSQPAYGHTPGHSLYILESGEKKLLFCGDLVHVEAIQFGDPSVAIKFDSDPIKATEQRKIFFADATKNGYLLAFVHLSFPGIGHIKKEGAHYRWIPVEYVNDAIKK